MSTKDRQNISQTIPWTLFRFCFFDSSKTLRSRLAGFSTSTEVSSPRSLRPLSPTGSYSFNFKPCDHFSTCKSFTDTFYIWFVCVWPNEVKNLISAHLIFPFFSYLVSGKKTHILCNIFLVQNYVCLLCISHWSHSRETSTQKRWCALGQIEPTSPFFKDTACSFYEIILEHSPKQIKPRSPFFFKIRTCNFRKSVSNIHACISPAWGPCQISFLL